MGNCESQGMLQMASTPVLGRLGPVADLKIVNSIWLRDYQGLFDFETKEVRRQILSASDNGVLFAEGKNKTVMIGKQTQFPSEMLKKALFEIVRKNNYYKILPVTYEIENETIQRPLWLVVRTVPQQKYPILEKDVLKFGKLRIKVREIVPYDTSNTNLNDFHSIKTTKKIYEDIRFQEQGPQKQTSLKDEIVSIATDNEQTCRICLEPGEINNPLICPCKCTGSVRYIHLSCLRNWLGRQLNVTKTKYVIKVKWVPLECEMCKSHYKYRIYLDNKKYYTVQIPKPARPYIVLEIPKKNVEYSKIFYFISMSETSRLTIGRKKDIDIKLSEDISVSRHHANLLYDFQSKKFLIEDNKSKFGTLVQIKRNLIINPLQRGITFQQGGQLFTFETNRTEGAIDDYHDQRVYLNLIEKDQHIEEEESDENNEEDYEPEQEEENPILINNSSASEARSMAFIGGSQAEIHHEEHPSNHISSLVSSAAVNLAPNPIANNPPLSQPLVGNPSAVSVAVEAVPPNEQVVAGGQEGGEGVHSVVEIENLDS